MTRKEAVQLASRALALYLACWGLSDLTFLPESLISIHHHYDSLTGPNYWVAYYGLASIFRLVRIVALFAGASWLYKGRKGVQEFFFPLETPNTIEEK
jgi:hypothetical protein